MRKQGWFLVAKPYIWFKKQSIPTNCKYRAIDRYEYVFHFSNSNKPKFRADNCRTEHSEVTKRRFKNLLQQLILEMGFMIHKKRIK
jgi:nicotinamide riboside kinase